MRSLRIFILGPFKSFDNSKDDLVRLTKLRDCLRSRYDAFLSFDKETVGKTDLKKLSTRERTLKLARFADLNLFVFPKTGIRDGVASELTEILTRFRSIRWKHVVLLDSGLKPSEILDKSKGGIFSIGPIKIIEYENDNELIDVAEQVAYSYSQARLSGTKP